MKTADFAGGMAPWLASDVSAESTLLFADQAELVTAAVAGAGTPVLVESPDLPDDPAEPQENGTATPTAVVVASLDQSIDGLLSLIRWNGAISYSDPDSAADFGGAYADPDSLVGFGQVGASQMLAIHFTLNGTAVTQPANAVGFSVGGFTNLDVSYAGAGTGNSTMRFANSSAPDTAYAYYPSTANNGGDMFFGPSGQTPVAGNYDWHTIIHEIGHALGLKHGHETDTLGALPADKDSLEFSVMTYRAFIGADTDGGYTYAETSAPQTFMMLDIAALQYMHGADYSANAGDTTYKWSPTSGDTRINGAVAIAATDNIFLTIWDGSGNDTYDLSAYTTDLVLDLRPGEGLNFGTQLADLGGGPNGGFARNNVFNALLFGANDASLIERAFGGSGNDTFIGNDATNYFFGGSGNDDITGGEGDDDGNAGAGNDTALLGIGADRMYGWNGNDNLSGEAGMDRLIGDAGADTLDGGTENDRLYGGSGNDILLGGDGADFIDGSGGDDNITGGAGADRLQGRVGADNFFFAGGSGADRIFGFENDIDTLFIDGSDYGYATAADVVADASVSGGNLFIDFGGGNSLNLWLFVTNGGVANDLLDDITII